MARALDQAERVAVVDDAGTWTYGDLLDRSAALAAALLDGRHDLNGARVLMLVPPGIDVLAALWAIWRAGGMAVPLSPAQTVPEWEHVARDSRASFAIAAPPVAAALAPVAVAAHVRMVPPDARARPVRLPDVAPGRDALMLYTSGTTSRPKGVVLTHAQVQAQVESLVDAWGWRAEDRLLHALPLHHTHGLINALTCPLWAGAVCELLPSFDVTRVWTRLASGDITVFMAVPTMYQRLLAGFDAADAATRRAWSDGARQLRLMVSGSAALPAPVFDRWRLATGQALLERYGMTETGMLLSNPLHGERRSGFVGCPLPGVDVRIVDDGGQTVAEGEPGEIQVRGPGVFRGYWDNPAATAEAMLPGGWFRTGDVGQRAEGMIRLLGRQSVDIIKTGGEKVSALEVEDVLREYPGILECAVVGAPDDEWGQCVCAVVVPSPGAAVSTEAIRSWAKTRLAPWKIPKRVAVMAELPRNALGKVTKARLADIWGHEGPGPRG
ncbi:MAG: acyl-CoA synthetase [Vicinamibacterales bacterium]|nr:acyl-CoA synthetase [Vicinamibacterales bacterium]